MEVSGGAGCAWLGNKWLKKQKLIMAHHAGSQLASHTGSQLAGSSSSWAGQACLPATSPACHLPPWFLSLVLGFFLVYAAHTPLLRGFLYFWMRVGSPTPTYRYLGLLQRAAHLL